GDKSWRCGPTSPPRKPQTPSGPCRSVPPAFFSDPHSVPATTENGANWAIRPGFGDLGQILVSVARKRSTCVARSSHFAACLLLPLSWDVGEPAPLSLASR